MNDPAVEMASLYVPAAPEEEGNPAVVKVVTDMEGYALYFSRSLIPYPRNAPTQAVKKHLGLYGYTARVLKEFTTWPVSPLEAIESLEQLRFLEYGVRIRMAEGIPAATAVDTPEQADEVRRLLSAKLQLP